MGRGERANSMMDALSLLGGILIFAILVIGGAALLLLFGSILARLMEWIETDGD